MAIRIDGTNTTANPGITGADADTGLQLGTDELKLVTGGTARATVDSSGNLGIGVTSPTAKLEVQGESNTGDRAAHIKAGDGGSTVALLVDGDQDTGDILIKCRSNDSATPTDSDTKFVVHGDGLVEVNSGYVQLNGTKVGGLQVTIADDAFASFTPPRAGGGFVFITQSGDTAFPGFICFGHFYADWGSSVKIDLQSLGGGLETNTGGPPDGTTGADAHATFFCGGNSNNGTAYLENRLGGSFAFDITFI